MAKMVSQLEQILLAGGSIIINGRSKMTSQLITLAKAAAQSGATLTLTGMGSKMTDQMVQISYAGDGNVVFDFTEKE